MPPLSKDKYYTECLIRHPELRKELLAFHQQFPPLFKRVHQQGKDLSQQLADTGPTWVQKRLHYQIDVDIWSIDANILPDQAPDCIIIVPQTFADLAQLYSPLLVNELGVAGYGRRLLPQDDQDYCNLMQIPPSYWQQAWETLQRRWPQVPEVFLRHGRLSDLNRSPLLISDDAFSDAKILIPVYSNTSLEDIEKLWGQVQRLKEAVYPPGQDESAPSTINLEDESISTRSEQQHKRREQLDQYIRSIRELMEDEEMKGEPADAGDAKQRQWHEELEQYIGELIALENEPAGAKRKKRRERPDQYAKRLRVWDAVQEYGTFAQAARRLRMKESTLKGIYLMASRDILGTPDHRNPRKRVSANFDPATHTRHCHVCQAAQHVAEMCPQARVYTSQDEGSLLGRPSATLDQLPDTSV